MRIKKFLALLVVLALTASLIPTAFASAEEIKNYNYVFSHSEHNHGDSRSLIAGTHRIDNMSESSSSPWGFVNGYKFNSLATYSGYLNWTIKDEEKSGVVFAPGEDIVPGVRAALAFEISASAGIYDASLSVKTTETPTELEVYLVPKEEYIFTVLKDNDSILKEDFYKQVEAMSANYRIGKIDLYNKSGDIYIGRVGLTAENYYLVLVPCGVNESAEIGTDNLWTMQLTNFKLDAVSESEGEEQEISSAVSTAKQTIDTGWTYSKYFTVETEGNVLTAYGACIYSYENTTDRIPMAVVEFTANATGTYNLQLKTNSDGISIKKFAAAPLVSYAKYDSVFATAMSDSSTSEGDTATALKALAGYNEIGYFDFSEQTAADTYSDVKKDGTSGTENGVLSLESGQKYFLAFSLDTKSLALASGTVEEKAYSGGTATGNETITNYSTKPSSGTKAYQAFIISGINLVPVVDETEKARQEAYTADRKLYEELTSVVAENNTKNALPSYSSTATVTVVAQDIATGDSVVSDVVNENIPVNTEYNPKTPEIGEDYEFAYWAVGLGANRKIVSFDKDEYSFKAAPGRNLVYAVYRKIKNDTKYAFFFDGSKTVLGKKAISNGSVTLPSLPGAMPGFGSPIGWKYTGEENEEALPESTEISNLTNDTFIVAAYNDGKNVSVTIDGQELNVPYGTEINLGDYAWVRENKNGDNVFNYWKKGSDIISFKPDYTFLAYEDCILTSTYGKYEPLNKTVRRILISEDKTTGITFAEFIGLDSAVEKGILFGDAKTTTYADARAKAVMQTDGNVFSVVNKTGDSAIGYAILSDGSIVYSDR